MPGSADLLVEPIHPVGASVRNLDVSSPDHLSRIPSLLYANGILLLPANSQAPNAPGFNTAESMEKIASTLGSLETEHPVNPFLQSSPVQKILTKGSTADAWIFHSDMTWNISPSLGCVLCMDVMPPSGGDTCFRSSTQMYDALSPDTKEKLSRASFVNSLKQSYGSVNTGHLVKTERFAVHPGVIRHPATGKACFYVNENTTTKAVGMSVEEGAELLRQAYDEAKDVGIYRHKWTPGDIVIWDNMGVQHMAMRDYTEKRVVLRASVGETWFRPDRFVADRGVDGGAESIRKRMEGSEAGVYDEEVARVFEHDMRECGYRLPEIAVSEIVKEVKKEGDQKEEVKVLDVGAGTGLVAMALMKADAERFKVDGVDRSEAMAWEGRRRRIYEEYYVGDVNEGMTMIEEDGVYDAVVCVDGLNRNGIEVEKALDGMVRVSKTGGAVILTVSVDLKEEVVREVGRLVEQGVVSVAADYNVVGFEAIPEFEFNVMVLKVL